MSNYLPPDVLNEIFTGLNAGLSLRAIARMTGTSTNTVKRYISGKDRRQCGCGAPAGHKGWCRWLYERSPRRQATIRRKWFQHDVSVPAAAQRRSRINEARERWSFVFGYADDWRDRATPLPKDEYIGVAGEAAVATKRVPFDVRDDVKHSIILAVYEGRVLRNQIEEVVPAFFKHEMKNTIGSMWSLWISLDEPLTHYSPSHGRNSTFLSLLAEKDAVDGDGVWRLHELQSGQANARG